MISRRVLDIGGWRGAILSVMDWIYLVYVYVALIGLAVGSFLNVVILRYHSGRLISGRSFCTSCGRKLAWYDLVPVFSFVFLRGRCGTCRARISWQYPLVELLTASVFVLAVAQFTQGFPGTERWLLLATQLLCWPLLIIICVYDFRHKIIPDALAYGFAGIALAFRLTDTFSSGLTARAWADLAAGPILFIPFFLLWFLSRGRVMGLGDGKLAVGMGWLLGLGGGISAILFGFWSGALVGLVLIALRRLHLARAVITMKSEVPFGPFLIAGVLAVSFFGFSVFKLFPLL